MRKIIGQRWHITWEWWRWLYIVFSLSWLFAPSLNHHLSTTGAFISQFEDPGQPWSRLYRLCDVIAGVVLGLAVAAIIRRRAERSKFVNISLVLLGIIAVGSIIDVVFPSACHHSGAFCFMPSAISRLVHTGESVVTVGALVALNIIHALKKRPWAKVVLLVQLIWVSVFIIGQMTSGNGNTLMQYGYQIVITLWLARMVPDLAGHHARPVSKHLQFIIHLIAGWIFASGFLAVITAIRNVREISDLGAAYFGNNTAWLSQHGIAVGLVLMYISRHLWRGEHRAWQLTIVLLWLETIKYAVITPDAALVLVYGLTAATLFVLRGAFDRQTSVEVLRERLQKLGGVAAAFILALALGVLALRLKHHQDLDTLHFSVSHFTQHLFLFDVVNDLGPLPRRLVGQALNVGGLALLFAVLFSLFRPQKPLVRPFNEDERQRVLDVLSRASNSTEDYFKYWPQPKSYWWNPDRTAAVAYRVVGNVAFALADPMASSAAVRVKTLDQFMAYCRQNGWLACFLMVGDKRQNLYKRAGYKLFRIGASALVDVDEFTTKTLRNKWWRWVMNKSKRQHWEYRLAKPPHNHKLLTELRAVSDAWLRRQNHQERGFALGYFDEEYLRQCRLHLLQHQGQLIAFANELPTFNKLPGATIDLMRFLPEYDHAMPTLLAHTIQQLHAEGVKRTFDLGFVPLASPTARTEQIIQKLGQTLMSEAVSAQGLEQFKNKFSPVWVHNYIAFDGDWIDLINISRQLDDLLEP